MIDLRLAQDLLSAVHTDLSRPHPFAFERVAFLTCRVAPLREDGLVLLAAEHHVVNDEDYERDDTVGAMLGARAFRRMLQLAYHQPLAVLHVHRHEHRGRPGFSGVDRSEAERYVPDFWKVRPHLPHGALVLSHDSATGLIWSPSTRRANMLARISVVGAPLQEIWQS